MGTEQKVASGTSSTNASLSKFRTTLKLCKSEQGDDNHVDYDVDLEADTTFEKGTITISPNDVNSKDAYVSI